MKTRSPRGPVAAFGAAVLAATAVLFAACTPPPTTAPGGTTTSTSTTTTVDPSTVVSVSNAGLQWAVSEETNAGVFGGSTNFWSAGKSDGTESAYIASDGNATVYKRNNAGHYVPINSDASVSWANRNANGAGTAATVSNGVSLDQQVRFTGGTGTVDTATGEATISWTGSFSINFYGSAVPFWFTDPTLVVDAAGNGELRADLGGYASDINNPTVKVPLTPASDVVVAELPNVSSANTSGFVADTGYLGNAITVQAGQAPQAAQTPVNAAYWGAWPQEFVDFQAATGLGAYWYTSGQFQTDPRKGQLPVTVTYNLAP